MAAVDSSPRVRAAEILAAVTGEAFTDDTNLETVSMDSLTLIEVLAELDDAGIAVHEPPRLEELRTVGDLLDLVITDQAARGAAHP